MSLQYCSIGNVIFLFHPSRDKTPAFGAIINCHNFYCNQFGGFSSLHFLLGPPLDRYPSPCPYRRI